MEKSKSTKRIIVLPIKAISINGAFQGRRYKTPEYKAWRDEVGWLLKPHKDKIIEWCSIEINVFTKNYGKMDIDNCIKPILDSLVESEIIKDDRFVESVKATKLKANMERIAILITET